MVGGSPPGDRGQGVELIPEEDLHPKYGEEISI